MIEFNLIHSFLKDRNSWERYYAYLDHKFIKENLKDVYKLLRVIDWYYRKYPTATHLTLPELEACYINNYPVLKENERSSLRLLLSSIEKAEVTDAIENYLSLHRTRSLASELAMVAFDVSEGRKELSDLDAVYSKFGGVSADVTSSDYVTDDLEELYNEQYKIPGLRWRLQFLNRSLGSLRPGNFGFVFARPETGKTTFLASECTNFASQTDKCILWCNNEQAGKDVMLRVYQAALGIPSEELFGARAKCMASYRDRCGDRIKIYDDAGMSMRSIEQRCKETNPGLIVLDQIDKIRGSKDDRYDLQMKEIYQWARELSKQYGPVIATCQAGGTAEGKRWLNMNDVDSSHTSKQGEADFIIGIGKSFDEGMGNIRFINIPKNKLIGDEDSLPELRHGRSEVRILPEIARFEDL